ncbi:MAG: leucine-rich repeat domain-containing protein [Saprospiraceae bacterium]|nr:leucine-rich repeat domain-containing protein [Saprospiraceae bacterium]
MFFNTVNGQVQITLGNVSYLCRGNGTYDIDFTLSGAPPIMAGVGNFDGYFVDAGVFPVVDCFNPSSYCPSCPCPSIYDPVCMCNGVQADNSQCAAFQGYPTNTPGSCEGDEEVLFTIIGVPVGLSVDITYEAVYSSGGNFPFPYTFTGTNCINCLQVDSLELVNLYNSTGGGTDTAWTAEWNLSTPVDTWTQGGDISLTTDQCNVETLINDFNDLEGYIPDLQLPLLKHLNLAGNNLTGAIPSFTNLRSLEEVFFSFNNLAGPVPNFDSLPNLKKLHFHTNNITGTLPNFSSLPNLRELSASNNKIDNLPIFTFFDASNQPFDLIEVDSNRLTFEDILPLLNLNYGTNASFDTKVRILCSLTQPSL